ncbi:hypothetical protein SBC1_24410 [Caballeronia sp. SBC1]|nr:hypothetical protein SBC2_25820 [Caballeronia sp. SBC2]QIN62427.1 hypothetical protein SBC1_24410 [Caballeronia sp. SBC1]
MQALTPAAKARKLPNTRLITTLRVPTNLPNPQPHTL